VANWREKAKWVNGTTVIHVLLLLVAFAIPAAIVAAEGIRRREWKSWTLSPRERHALYRVMVGLFILTLLGYLIWVAESASRGFGISSVGQLSSDAASGASYTIRQETGTVPGLTTATQFGIAVTIIGAILGPAYRRSVKYMMGTVLVLAAARAYINSERLAFIEVAVPMAVVLLSRAYTRESRGLRAQRRRRRIWWAPIVAIPVLVLGFAGLEYYRSWQSYKATVHTSELSWAANRLDGYYSTSYNNAQMLTSTNSWPQPRALPVGSIPVVWNIPVLDKVFNYKAFTGFDWRVTQTQALTRYTNAEFNNFSGILWTYLDYGIVGGMIFIGLFGALTGGLYAAFAQRRRWGLLLYPLFVEGLIDLPRVTYLLDGRAFPAIVGLVWAGFSLRRARMRDRRADERRATAQQPRGSLATISAR